MPPKARPVASGARQPLAKPAAAKTTAPPAETEVWRTDLFRNIDRSSVVQRSNANGGEKYEGQVSDDGKRHGKGMLWWPNGNVYAGEWAIGAMSGIGTFHYATEGDRYAGGFRDDKKHGGGKYTFANGNSYGGEFAFDKRHGRGKYAWMCGDEYDGEWFEGRMHGTGITAYANGNKYVGSFVEDRREGRGKLTCTDGLAYDGEWLNNNRHGEGRLDFPSGDYYQGEWAHDKKDGKGKDSFANGNVYTGEYRANAKHGQGRMTYNNGDVYDGTWAHDKMDGRGVYRFSNGFVYDGEWREDMRHGEGQYTFPNGHVYTGSWASDRRHGPGRLTLSTSAPENAGETYRGTWHDGKMHGDFDVTEGSGQLLYRGEWREGAPCGNGAFWLRYGEASVTLAGHLDIAPNAKKGMGTIERVPTVVASIARAFHLRVPSCRSAEGGAHAHAVPLCLSSSAPPPLHRPGDATHRNVADVVAALSSEASKSRSAAMDAALEAQRVVAASSQALAATRKSLAQLGSLDAASAKAGDAVSALEELHQRESTMMAAVALRAEAVSQAKQQEGERLTEVDARKGQVVELRQRIQNGEQADKDARASADRLAQLSRSLVEAEDAASAAETQSATLRQNELAAAEAEKARLDSQLQRDKAALAETEASVTALHKSAREGAAERKARLKHMAESTRELDGAVTDHKHRLSKAAAAASELETSVDAVQKKHQKHEAAAERALADAEAELGAVDEEALAVQGDMDDVTNEAASIAVECDKKTSANDARAKEIEKLQLQLRLYSEDEETETQRVAVATARDHRTRDRLREHETRQDGDRIRRQLRQQLDRELLAAETDTKKIEALLLSAQSNNDDLRGKLTSLLNVPTASAGSGVNRLRSMRSTVTPPIEDPAAVQELEEQLRSVKKKLAKKREKLAQLHGEAQEACSAWLPSDRDAASGVLASAARESHLNQVMKLRNQLDRLLKDVDGAQSDLARKTGHSDGDDEDEGGNDDERYLRDIIRSMRASDRDWRVNYLLDQLAARQQQVVELRKEAAYAKELDRKVMAANSEMSGFKQQPRSAGMKPFAEGAVPLRSTPGLSRRNTTPM